MHLIPGFCLVFVFSGFVFTDDSYFQIRACCLFRDFRFSEIEYTLDFCFDKLILMEYNSTRGKWTAFTPETTHLAPMWNMDPFDKIERQFEKHLLCEQNLDFIQNLGNLSTPPTVSIKLVEQTNERCPAMLVCSAYDFYPKQIKMKWLQNDKEITTGVSYSDAMPDGEFYYQMHSFLEFTPISGEKITCVVEHYSLSEPEEVSWDNSLPPEEETEIIWGLCGFLLGLITLGCGFVYYKKTSSTHITFCQRQMYNVAGSVTREETEDQ